MKWNHLFILFIMDGQGYEVEGQVEQDRASQHAGKQRAEGPQGSPDRLVSLKPTFFDPNQDAKKDWTFPVGFRNAKECVQNPLKQSE